VSSAGEVSEGGELPEVDFSTFVLSLAHSVLVHLGQVPPPPGETVTSVNLLLARQTIDLLTLLADKTKGNLTGAEERLLEQLLYDVRSRYVEAAR
jgi:Domain of unknown function (DUF1844)